MAASWSFTENCNACTAIILGVAYILNARSTPSSLGTPPGGRTPTIHRKKAPAGRHGGQHAPAHWHARLTRASSSSRTPPSRPRGVACSSIFRFEFLIRRSQLQILLLHNGRELVEIF